MGSRKHKWRNAESEKKVRNEWIKRRPPETRMKQNSTPKNKAKDSKVIPDPIDDRKFQEWKESGKSGILLGMTLNPKKCIGEKVRRIPINVEIKW